MVAATAVAAAVTKPSAQQRLSAGAESKKRNLRVPFLFWLQFFAQTVVIYFKLLE
jgi:hypothetical protein